MKKSIKCTVLCVLVVCCIVFSLPISASAADVRNYSFNFSEPSRGEGQGYIVVEYRNTITDVYYLQCFFWNSFLVGSSNIDAVDDTSMFITVSDDTVSFAPIYQSQYGYASVFSYFMNYDNSLNRYYYREVSSPMQTIYSFTFGASYDIVAFEVYGDFVSVETDITNRDTFNFVWGETKLVLDELAVLISQMQEALSNDEEALELFYQILTNTNDIEELLDGIYTEVYLARTSLYFIRVYVEEIRDILKASGESTFEEPDTGAIDDYNKAEGDLVNGADDTADIEGQIGEFEIDANASGTIWDMITQFFNSHPKVMGLAIGLLCLGIIALILNR